MPDATCSSLDFEGPVILDIGSQGIRSKFYIGMQPAGHGDRSAKTRHMFVGVDYGWICRDRIDDRRVIEGRERSEIDLAVLSRRSEVIKHRAGRKC